MLAKLELPKHVKDQIGVSQTIAPVEKSPEVAKVFE
jgi:hypothetical protein